MVRRGGETSGKEEIVEGSGAAESVCPWRLGN